MENQIIIQLPTEVSELANKVSVSKQAEVNTVLTQIFTGTADWESQVDAIEVKGIDDKMSIELAEVARKNAKTARLSAEKIFDAKREEVQQMKAEYDLEDKLWLKAKQVMQLKFKSIEEKAEWKANYVKRYEAEQKELRTQNRILQIAQYAEINRIEFENMSDEVFESFLGGLKSAHEAKIAEAARIEAERIEKARLEAERIEAQRLENIRLKAEAEARERQIEEERKANEQRLAEERAKAKAEADRIEAENKARLEAEQAERKRIEAEQAAKLKAEQEEKERLAAELKAKQEAEAKAIREKQEAEEKARKEAEKAAKAPIKKQMVVWIDSFQAPSIAVSNEKVDLIKQKFEAFKSWAKAEIEQI